MRAVGKGVVLPHKGAKPIRPREGGGGSAILGEHFHSFFGECFSDSLKEKINCHCGHKYQGCFLAPSSSSHSVTRYGELEGGGKAHGGMPETKAIASRPEVTKRGPPQWVVGHGSQTTKTLP